MRISDKWLWFFIRIFTNFVGATFFVVFSFLLWSEGKSIQTLLEFNFYTFLSLFIGIVLVGELMVFFSLKKIFILGLIARIGLVLFLYVNSDQIADYVVLSSIIYGLSSAFFWNSEALFGQEIVGEKNLISYSSLLQIAFSLLSILSPFFVNFVFGEFSTDNYLLLVAGLMFLAILVSLPLKNVKSKNNKSALDSFRELKDQKAIRDLAYMNMSIGFGTAFSMGILDIIILEKLGTLENWTYFAFILALGGIFVTNVIRKIKFEETGKIRVLISFGLLLYAAIPILLYSFFNLYVLIAFIFAKVIYDKIISAAFFPYTVGIQAQDTAFAEKKIDYTVFSNLFWIFGRIIPIGILIAIPQELVTIDVLLYLLLIITFVPLYFASKLKTRYRNYFDA